jgi:AraC-like DNA-binding protein
MNAYYHKVQIEQTKSFDFRNERISEFEDLFHFHPEVELRYIEKGEGIQYIGNDISTFSEGSLFLLGENLPHAWRFDKDSIQNREDSTISSLVIEFSTQFSSQLLNLPEVRNLKTLFDMAKQGLEIKGKAKQKIITLLTELEPGNSQNSTLELLQIIKVLSETNEFSTISPIFSLQEAGQDPKHHRLEKVYSFVQENYNREIKLDQVANLANFSVGAFCLFFKSINDQTFFEYVNQTRISMACRKLAEKDASIEMICYECGFNTLSNFNRLFRRTTGMTPSVYKKVHLSVLKRSNRIHDSLMA